jgi:hypothetical protein
MGTALNENAKNVTKALCRDVLVTEGMASSVKPDVDATLPPRVASVERNFPLWQWQTQETVIYGEWTLTDLQGDVIWVNIFKGMATGKTGNTRTAKALIPQQLHQAMQELFTKIFAEISTSPEIRRFASTRTRK